MERKLLLTVLALTIILLASIPLCALAQEPRITVAVSKLEIDPNAGKPPTTPGGKPNNPSGGNPRDYVLLGFKWTEFNLKITVSTDSMKSAVELSASEWDSHTGVSLVNEVVVDGSASFNDELDAMIPDGINELVFDDLDSGIIAVCYTWYIEDEIVQFDIAFNTDYPWGDAESNSALMDLQNIATHELGHGFGLGDIYKRPLSYLTMYGFSYEGDIAKRDLAQGDIDGIQALYGA